MLIAVLAVTVMLAALSAEVWRRWALHRGVVDRPGSRSSHSVPTPRGGGIGIALGLLVGLALLAPASPERHAALLAIALVAFVGLIDDLRPLPPFVKLTGQAIAAFPLAMAMPWPLLPSALLPGAELPPFAEAGLATALAFAFALLAVNAWNFMDGINGIASIAAISVGIVALLVPGASAADALAWAMVAACVGFLPLNFPQARVFMGDCGSHALGMAIAALILFPASWGHDRPMLFSAAALAAASPFLIDVLGTLARRALDGERLTEAHRRHLYQMATRSGYSHAVVTVAYGAWMVTSGASVVFATVVLGVREVGVALAVVANAGIWVFASRRFEDRARREGSG